MKKLMMMILMMCFTILSFSQTESDTIIKISEIDLLKTEVIDMKSHLYFSAKYNKESLVVGLVGVSLGTLIACIPLMSSRVEPIGTYIAAVAIAGGSSIISLSLKISSIKHKRKAGSLIKF